MPGKGLAFLTHARTHRSRSAGGSARLQARRRNRPLRHDEVDIEHVAINPVVEAPAPPREEGDLLIIPVYEEVVTVHRQWVLKEEIRLRRREVQTRHREQVNLRREQATVQRSSSNPEESKDGEDGSRNDGQPG